MTEAPSELELVGELAGRARAGDRAAFGALYERYASTVHGIALARVAAPEAQDLVQEVFLVALEAIATLQDPARFGAWLVAIARNRALDRLRARGRAASEEGMDFQELEDPRPGEPADEEEARAALAAVRTLPAAYRETLILRLVEGLSGPEIAARCGMTHGSVRVNLHRGMKLLRERLPAAGSAPREPGRTLP